ncbi:hypothetical protein DB346_24365 [Verrucomicrobia bacterium LW23]|nr:hypothetical protein DB346_24365 [Verrucomicrobia bacterium LW23]
MARGSQSGGGEGGGCGGMRSRGGGAGAGRCGGRILMQRLQHFVDSEAATLLDAGRVQTGKHGR